MCIVDCQFQQKYKDLINKYFKNNEFEEIIFILDKQEYCLFHSPMKAVLNTKLEKYKYLNSYTKEEIFYNHNDIYCRELQNIFYNFIYYLINYVLKKFYNYFRYRSYKKKSKRFYIIEDIIINKTFFIIDLYRVIFPLGLTIDGYNIDRNNKIIEYNKLLKFIANDFIFPIINFCESEFYSILKIKKINIIALKLDQSKFYYDIMIEDNNNIIHNNIFNIPIFSLNDIIFYKFQIKIVNNKITSFEAKDIQPFSDHNIFKFLIFQKNDILSTFDISIKNTENLKFIKIIENKFGYDRVMDNYEYSNGSFNFTNTSIDTDMYFFSNCFYKAPNFYGTTFNKLIDFNGCSFLDYNYQAYSNYRYIKNLMKNKNMDKEEKHFWKLEEMCKINYKISYKDINNIKDFIKIKLLSFFSLILSIITFGNEKFFLGFILHNQNYKIPNKSYIINLNSQVTENIASKFYNWSSDYGTNFNKILFIIILSILSFSLIYYFFIPTTNCYIIDEFIIHYKECFKKRDFVNSLYKSINISFTLNILELKNLENNSFLLNLVFLFECIFNKILFIILVFMLRKRFKIEN